MNTFKNKILNIAQIAPLYESIPPKLYGGTERIVHYLTEELINQGHQVTLFASKDSKSNATIISPVDRALRLNEKCTDPLAYHIIQMQQVLQRVHEFDVLHFHTDYLHFPFTNNLNIPALTTLHGRLDSEELQAIYDVFPNQKVISISENHRLSLPHANFIKTVYHGLPENLLESGNGRGGYFAFLGRVSPEKGLDKAIEIAISTKTNLKIAAKIDKADYDYFEKNIKHLLDHPLIEYIGEITENQKSAFLGNAKALLFPINWPEPFGLVMIEAMACGTPVIAFENGSVPEIIENGVTGFIVNDVHEAIKATFKLSLLNRKKIRQVFEQRFTARGMAQQYIRIYQMLENSSSHLKINMKETKITQAL